MTFDEAIELAGKTLDLVGVAAILGTTFVVMVLAAGRLLRGRPGAEVFTMLRRQLGRGILLGLEILVAADIIRTVAVSPTISSVIALGLIVLIRTFLSFSLEVELRGRWPWQGHKTQQDPGVG